MTAAATVPNFVARPAGNPAFQTAYGVLGRFSAPPVKPGQMLLMDFQDDFLTPAERTTPTFLYAMDLGDGLFFAEETSLSAPARFGNGDLEGEARAPLGALRRLH